MLKLGLQKVLSILKKCHVRGEEAKAYGEALEIIEAFIKVLEDGEKEKESDEDRNQQRKESSDQLDLGSDANDRRSDD